MTVLMAVGSHYDDNDDNDYYYCCYSMKQITDVFVVCLGLTKPRYTA